MKSIEAISEDLGKKYFISAYGRFGYVVVFLGCIPFCAFIAAPFFTKYSVGFRIFAFIMGVSCDLLMIYSITQIFRTTPRFIVYGDGFYYKGLFLKKYYKWHEIESGFFRLHFFAYVLLLLKDQSKLRRGKALDLSGLTPNYRELFSELDQHIKFVNKAF